MLDTNSKVDVSLRKKLIIQLNKINLESIDDWVNMSKGFKLKDEVGVPLLLLTSLKKILLAGYSLKDYESVITYFNLGNENNYYNLVPIQDISYKFNDIYIILKQIREIGVIEEKSLGTYNKKFDTTNFTLYKNRPIFHCQNF